MMNRRAALKASGAAALGAMIAPSGASSTPDESSAEGLIVAGYAYDRVRAIDEGRTGIEAAEINFVSANIYELNGQVLGGGGSRYHLPEDFPLFSGPAGVDESELILQGGCDALITAITPRAVAEGNPKVRTLFSDFRAVEQDYYRRTGLFPIMHAVAIRADLAEKEPSLPAAIFQMYSKAKQYAYQDLASTTVLRTSLPWAADEYESTRALMGDDYWRYGIQANSKELRSIVRYAHEQGLIGRKMDYLEMFHPKTHGLIG